jgi:hypothetical protein
MIFVAGAKVFVDPLSEDLGARPLSTDTGTMHSVGEVAQEAADDGPDVDALVVLTGFGESVSRNRGDGPACREYREIFGSDPPPGGFSLYDREFYNAGLDDISDFVDGLPSRPAVFVMLPPVPLIPASFGAALLSEARSWCAKEDFILKSWRAVYGRRIAKGFMDGWTPLDRWFDFTCGRLSVAFEKIGV